MSEKNINAVAFKRIKSNLVNKLNNTLVNTYPHYIVPGYNLNKLSLIKKWNEKNALELYQKFPYNCDLPKPLLPPAKLSRTVISKEDPALQLLTLKNQLKDDIDRIVNHYNKHKKKFDKLSKKNIKWKSSCGGYKTKIPRYVANLAQLIEMDPDPYFEGSYNWYYTGGSLNFVQLNDWNVLLFPFMGDLVAANIVPMKDSIWKPSLQNSAKCKLHGLLYEIRQSRINDTCRILTRHKNNCTLYMLTNPGSHLMLNEVHHKASNIPYVSADLSLIDPNLYCTLTAERVLFLWDINKKKYVNSGCVQKNITSDVWGSIKFQEMDPNILIYTNRCCLHYIDIRTDFDCPSLTLCPKFNLENCERLSVEAPSRHPCCRYLGAYHSFLMCDNRSPKQCVRQKWTHQFKNTPLLATVTNSNDKEIIVLSSQTVGENAIILNTWLNEEDSHSYNMPFTPTCITETLNESQMQGMCLNPYLQSRFELCNTGSTLITDTKNGSVFYFSQNSIDDVFYQCITHKEKLDKYSPENSKACYALNMWEKALSAQAEPLVPLTITDKYNMQHIYKNFTNRKLRLQSSIPNKNDFDPSWKQSLAMLESYIDLLAPELLAMWDIREENLSLPVTTTSHQKVLNWLDNTTVSNLKSTQSQNISDECISNQAESNIEELFSISVNEDMDLEDIEDSNMLQELLLPKVKSKSKKRKLK